MKDTAMRNLMLGAIAALLATPAAAQDQGSRPTREFVQAAAQSDAFEMFEANTALAESKDPQVRAFAEQMMRDHTTLDQSLRSAAQQAGLMPPPVAISSDQSAFLAALQSARGKDFDRLYARQQVLGHRAALVTHQQYAGAGDTPTMRQAANTAVPIVSAHLSSAEQLMASLGGS